MLSLGMDVDLQFGAGVFPRECQDLRNSISPLTTLSLSLSLSLDKSYEELMLDSTYYSGVVEKMGPTSIYQRSQ